MILHVLERHISEDTGVVDQDIDSSKGIDSGFNDLVSKLDRIVVGSGLASSGLDLVDDSIGSLEPVRYVMRRYLRADGGVDLGSMWRKRCC